MANTAASSLITSALDNLARASIGTSRSGATLSTKALVWLNDALKRVSRLHDFSELIRLYSTATVASTKTYAVPALSKTILSLRLIDGTSSITLEQVDPRVLDKYMPYPEDAVTGRSVWYTIYGKTIELYPIPDDAYTLYCRCADEPATITDSSTLIDYTPDKDSLIIADMTASGFRYMQMYEDAIFWDKEFTRLLRECIDSDDRSPDWAPYGEGFNASRYPVALGDPWNDPLVWRQV